MFSTSAIAGTPVINAVARTWWLWLIRGLAAIIFGLLAFTWPGLTWITIAILFGAYALVDGIFAIIAAVRAVEHQQRWWPFLLEGLVGILIAAITWYDIRITIAALYLTIAAWAFIPPTIFACIAWWITRIPRLAGRKSSWWSIGKPSAKCWPARAPSDFSKK